MVWRRTIWRVLWLVCLVLTGLFLTGPVAHAQRPLDPLALEQDEPTSRGPMSYVPPHRDVLLAISQQARAHLKQGQVADGLNLLQRILDLPEDYFVDASMRSTVKSEAGKILSELSPPERAAYELLQGSVARHQFELARDTGNSRVLEEVQRRFPVTQAGIEAAELLAAEALDHGQFLRAAHQLSQLRALRTLSPEQAWQLGFQEAFARAWGGQTERAAQLLVELSAHPAKIRLPRTTREVPSLTSIPEAQTWLSQNVRPALTHNRGETTAWLTVRGQASGMSIVAETAPIGQPVWQTSLVADLAENVAPPAKQSASEMITRLLDSVEEPLIDAELPTWLTSTPLLKDELMVFRTGRDIVAMDRQTGKLRWRSILADPHFDELWSQLQTVPTNAQLTPYLRQSLYENQTYGSLSSDGHAVFAVESAEFPKSPENEAGNNARRLLGNSEPVWTGYNRLVAYELSSGRLLWEIGGDRAEIASTFAGYFFLGPPVVTAGRLVQLAEVQGELRLLMLDVQPVGVQILWSQPLVIPERSIEQHLERRRQGLMPAAVPGVIVCPTSTGAVIAVDEASRKLLWSYTYASTIASGLANLNPLLAANLARIRQHTDVEEPHSGWLDGNPVIVDGRVFITPRDSEELHCLDLIDGKLLWSVPRDRGLYVAGVDRDQVVVVGLDRLLAYRVTDGSPAWAQTVHVPRISGRGVWMDGRMLLPLATGEIASIDVQHGRLLARSRLPTGLVPGNLTAISGELISVSSRAAVGFRGLNETESHIATTLSDHPNDAASLALRGEIQLHRGKIPEGLTDLRAALARDPDPNTQAVLATALMEGLRTDFASYRPSIAELEKLTLSPAQQQEFLWLVAHGLQTAGEPLAAFDQLTNLIANAAGEMPSQETFGMPLKVRNDRRLAGMFEMLYRTGTAAEQQAYDQRIAARLNIQTAGSPAREIEHLQQFLGAFGFHRLADSARKLLLDRLDPELQAEEWEWACYRLSESGESSWAAFAAGQLARRRLSQRRYADVLHWIMALETKWPDVKVEPELTSRQLAAQLRANPDLQAAGKLPLPWPAGVIEQTPNKRQNLDGMMLRVPVYGPVPDRYLGWSFEIDHSGTVLIARDDQGRQRWRWEWNMTNSDRDQIFSEPYHRIVLHDQLIGWSNGADFQIAADTEPERLSPRSLWTQSLVTPGISAEQKNTDRIGNVIGPFGGRPRRNEFRWATTVPGSGALIGITDNAVIYHNGRKLFATDPLTGKMLWSRRDLPQLITHITADDQSVLIIGPHDQARNQRGMIRVFRTMDGEETTPLTIPTQLIEWVGSRYVLRWVDTIPNQAQPDQAQAAQVEYVDLVQGTRLWTADVAKSTVFRVWQGRELFTLEENGRCSVRNLSDGQVRWNRDVTLDVQADQLFVQRWRDRYLVTMGLTKLQRDHQSVVGFEMQDTALDGNVFALSRETGETLWNRRVKTTAYNDLQPVGWPILVYAGRLIDGPPGNLRPTRLSALLLDKETGDILGIDNKDSADVGRYFLDVEPERNRLTVNFLKWAIDLRYTGKPAQN